MADRPTAQKVFRNSMAMTGATIIILLMGFVVIPVAIHRVGLALYGVWVILSGVLSYFSLFDLGVGGTFVTQLAMAAAHHERHTVRQIITISLLLYVAMGVALSPVAYYVAPRFGLWFHLNASDQHIAESAFWWVYAYLFLSQSFSVFGSLSIALQKLRLVSTINVLFQIVNYTVLLIGLARQWGLYAFIIANYVSWIGTTIVYGVLTVQWLRETPLVNPLKISKTLIKTLLAFGGWIQINRLSNQINNETDRILIGLYVSAAAAGVYQVGNKLALLSRRFPLNFSSALLPVFSVWEAQHQSQEHIRSHYVDASRYLALATFFLSGLIAATSTLIMYFWLHHRYSQFFLIVSLLLITYTVNNLTGIGTTYLRGIGKPRLESYYAIVGSVLKLGLSLSLASRWGLFGILLGTAAGTVLGSAYFLWLFFRVLSLDWWHGLGQWVVPIIASTLPALLVIRELSHWALSLGTGRATTFLSLLIMSMLYTLLFALFLRISGFYADRDINRLAQLMPTSWLHVIELLHLIPVLHRPKPS